MLKYFHDSYSASPIATVCEFIQMAFLIVASIVLTYTVLDPATKIFIPMYFIGSAIGIISAIIRNAVSLIVLGIWFSLMNGVALWKLFL